MEIRDFNLALILKFYYAIEKDVREPPGREASTNHKANIHRVSRENNGRYTFLFDSDEFLIRHSVIPLECRFKEVCLYLCPLYDDEVLSLV